jgi:predicted AlkP superfamily pyrophosphatase or phosphodiesterase
MAISLYPLILRVQLSLSDLPDNYISDEQLYSDLKSAKIYIDSIKTPTFSNDTLEEEALVRLGAYLSYANYTSLAERQLGTIPNTTDIKLNALRRLALAFLRRMTNFKLSDDLSVDHDDERKSFVVTMGNAPSIFSD